MMRSILEKLFDIVKCSDIAAHQTTVNELIFVTECIIAPSLGLSQIQSMKGDAL